MKRPFHVFFVLCGLSLACAWGQDSEAILNAPTGDRPALVQFRDAFAQLIQGDQARDRGQLDEAARLYADAGERYKSLAATYPDWQPGLTRFRVAYCENQLTALARMKPEAGVAATPGQPAGGDSVVAVPESRTGVDRQAELEDLLSRAKALMARNQSSEARELLIKGMAINPDDVSIRMLIGTVHCQNGDYENAVYVLQPLVDGEADSATARVALGAAFFGLGRLLSAEEQMRRALVLSPQSAEAHYNLSQILLSMNPPEQDKAREHYLRALALGGAADPEVEENLGLSRDVTEIPDAPPAVQNGP